MPYPLSERIRPTSIDQIVGQKHILNSINFLNEFPDQIYIPNMIFYGPPGTGKTTLANIIAKKINRTFIKLNATTSTISEIKNILNKTNSDNSYNGIIIGLDEIQYFNKKQQQSLLEFMENGSITLIASTTENPYFCIYPAILSRSHIFEFKPVKKEDIIINLKRAVKFLEEEYNEKLLISEKTLNEISMFSYGDVRKAVNLLEICFLSSRKQNNNEEISLNDNIKHSQENFSITHDIKGNNHYDLLSAFQKSLRGSDPDASIYYLARLLSVGEISSVCRRLLVCVCEDVGLAYPAASEYVKNLTDIALQVGMPEARIPLANAALIIALSPKSNSAYNSINLAMKDIKDGLVYPIPNYLKNENYYKNKTLNNLIYHYPNDYKNHWFPQSYLPKEMTNKKYYYPQTNKNESTFKNYWDKIKNKNSK